MQSWLLAEIVFYVVVVILAIEIGAKGSTVEDEDGTKHQYLLFILQLLILNMLPHIAAKYYLFKSMLSWPYRKVKNFENGMFLSHSMLVLFSTILGLSIYHSASLMNAIPDSGFFLEIIMIGVFCYIYYWSLVGMIISITLIAYGIIWLVKCPSRRQR